TDDPRHAFALALRLIDETGLAAKSKVEDRREVAPEPRAPELRLTLVDENSECREFDHPEAIWYEEDIRFHAALRLAQVREGWTAQPLDAEVEIEAHRSDRSVASLSLSMEVGSLPGGHHVSWHLELQAESASLSRSPWRCGEESRDLPLDQVATERRW